MQEAVSRMLARYESRTIDDFIRALREIIQEVALLGLSRAKFFEHAAFYGGTALRILYGLDRFSEDLDFSLLKPMSDFDLGRYTQSLQEEVTAFGFDVRVERIDKAVQSPIQSAFLKANTRNELLLIAAPADILRHVPRGQGLKVKFEIDTDPPPGFDTEMRYLLHPIPFSARVYSLPDLFAGKMHAILCRRWKNRVKGRDWYDFVWFVTNHPQLHLSHLEQRMRQTGHWTSADSLTPQHLRSQLDQAIEVLNVEQARREVSIFVSQPETLAIWSREFFHDIVRMIRFQ